MLVGSLVFYARDQGSILTSVLDFIYFLFYCVFIVNLLLLFFCFVFFYIFFFLECVRCLYDYCISRSLWLVFPFVCIICSLSGSCCVSARF